MSVQMQTPAKQTPLLEVAHLTVRFGGNLAVDDLNLTLRPRERAGLIGPNGAGKSTTVNAITGFIRCEGDLRLESSSLTGMPPFKRARSGLVRTYQNLELFATMSVAENLAFGASLARRSGAGGSQGVRAEEILELLHLSDYRHHAVSRLAYGTRKVVELARALVSNPRVLLLDEPMAGLDTAEKGRFVEILDNVFSETDAAVLLIEHDMFAVERLTETVYVLDAGRMIASGAFQQVAQQQAVIDAYLGA